MTARRSAGDGVESTEVDVELRDIILCCACKWVIAVSGRVVPPQSGITLSLFWWGEERSELCELGNKARTSSLEFARPAWVLSQSTKSC